MSMWGRRDSESPAEVPDAELPADARQARAQAGTARHAETTAEPGQQAGEPASEAAPALRRAEGETPESGRPPAQATPSAYGRGPAEAPAVSESPAGADAPAPTPEVGESPAGTDALVPVAEEAVTIDEEVAVKEPVPAAHAQDTGSPAAGSPVAAGPISSQRWSEITATFVDDPRGSVRLAADAVDSAIEEFVTSVRARQQALASSWQGSETDTEQLRTALREYRRFGAQLPQVTPSGPAVG